MFSLENPLVLDGALGTQLEREYSSYLEEKNLNIQKHPLWSALVLLKEPQVIENIHLSYMKAGADIITTGTYQASKLGLQKYASLTDDEVLNFYKTAVDVVLKAKKTFVAEISESAREIVINGSVGPYGGYLANGAEYTGDYGDIILEDLVEFHRPLVESYISNDLVDIIGFETVPNFLEVKAILALMHSNLVKKKFYISFNFKDNSHICDGTSIETVMKFVIENQPEELICVGANCIKLPDATSILSSILKFNVSTPKLGLIVYPNAGLDYNLETAQYTVSEVDKEIWDKRCQEWINKYNVNIIGGCCGSGPRDTGIIRSIIDVKK